MFKIFVIEANLYRPKTESEYFRDQCLFSNINKYPFPYFLYFDCHFTSPPGAVTEDRISQHWNIYMYNSYFYVLFSCHPRRIVMFPFLHSWFCFVYFISSSNLNQPSHINYNFSFVGCTNLYQGSSEGEKLKK